MSISPVFMLVCGTSRLVYVCTAWDSFAASYVTVMSPRKNDTYFRVNEKMLAKKRDNLMRLSHFSRSLPLSQSHLRHVGS